MKDVFDTAIDIIWDAIESAWDILKKIWVKIVNFAKNIISWFKDPTRIKKLKENNNNIAVAIKRKMENGDFEVVNCLFDEEKSELVDGEIIETENIDQETKNNFGNKDMIVLK